MNSSVLCRFLIVALPMLQDWVAGAEPGGMAAAYRDPYERTNRKIFAFNKNVDRIALHPATNVYRAILPGFARQGITNFINNAEEPLSIVNAALQGSAKKTARLAIRFVINTTVGVGGFVDHASRHGRPDQKEDFGQTLAVWGVKSGPYLMLPLLGPSTFRDTAGRAGDIFADPASLAQNYLLNTPLTYSIAEFGLKGLDTRSQLIDSGADEMLAASLDDYVVVRSAYLQRRQSQIYDGNLPESDAPPQDLPSDPNPKGAGVILLLGAPSTEICCNLLLRVP